MFLYIYDEVGHQYLHICFQTMNFKRGNYGYYIISIISAIGKFFCSFPFFIFADYF